jgi:hypothetical protein
MLFAKPSVVAARRSRATTFRAVSMALLLVAGLLLAYRFGRLLVAHPRAVAVGNATHLIACEHAMRLPNELLVQHALLASHTVTRLANVYYVSVHFPLTAAFLVWLFVRSRSLYYEIRTAMALLTGFALIIHAVFPLAPARMLHGFGFVDTAALYGPSVYTSSPQTDHVTNQFAAMPSLHFGWAVMVALGFVRVGRSRLRWLWIAHPVITLLVIVGTGNHYWADAIVATVLLVLAQIVAAAWTSAYRVPQRIAMTVGRSPAYVPCPCPDHPADGPQSTPRGPALATSGGARAPPRFMRSGRLDSARSNPF